MLHTVNKSPFERNALKSCLRLAAKGAPILFFEDGVYAATKSTTFTGTVETALKDHPLFVLDADLMARGIDQDKVIDGVTVVDYGGFVDLVVEHGTVAWL